MSWSADHPIETLSDALHVLRSNASSAEPVHLLFSWVSLRSAGIGYAMAIVAKARAAYPQTPCLCVLDAGEDAGLALSALKAGADRVRFSGAPQSAQKLAEIAHQLYKGFDASPAM